MRRSTEKSPLLHYIESIEPLEFDLALFNEYISEIADGTIPQGLVDEVEALYEANHYYQKRREAIDAIGNLNIDFEFYPVHQCITLMENFINDNDNPIQFAETFLEIYELIDDDYDCDSLKRAAELCEMFLREEISTEDFIRTMGPIYTDLKALFYKVI